MGPSHRKASQAQREGLFDNEIVSVDIENPIQGREGKVARDSVSKDDGIRQNVDGEAMAKLKPFSSQTGARRLGIAVRYRTVRQRY